MDGPQISVTAVAMTTTRSVLLVFGAGPKGNILLVLLPLCPSHRDPGICIDLLDIRIWMSCTTTPWSATPRFRCAPNSDCVVLGYITSAS